MAKNKDEELAAKDELVKQLQQQIETERSLRIELNDKHRQKLERYYEMLWVAARAIRGGGTGKSIRDALGELKVEIGDKRVEEMEKKWRGVTNG